MSYKINSLKVQLLKSSIDIISKEGLRSLTMRNLALKIGVSQTALYRHYASKNELLCAVIASAYQALSVEFERITTDEKNDSFDQLILLGKAYVFFALHNPTKFKLMFSEEIQKAAVKPDLKNDILHCYNFLVTSFEKCQREGKLSKKIEISTMANCYWSLVYGVSILLIDNQVDILAQNLPLPLPDPHYPIVDDKAVDVYLDKILNVTFTGFRK